jgi:uncharacterized membrane protein
MEADDEALAHMNDGGDSAGCRQRAGTSSPSTRLPDAALLWELAESQAQIRSNYAALLATIPETPDTEDQRHQIIESLQANQSAHSEVLTWLGFSAPVAQGASELGVLPELATGTSSEHTPLLAARPDHNGGDVHELSSASHDASGSLASLSAAAPPRDSSSTDGDWVHSHEAALQRRFALLLTAVCIPVIGSIVYFDSIVFVGAKDTFFAFVMVTNLVMGMAAACAPDSPSPDMIIWVNAVFVVIVAAGFHIIGVKWQDTVDDEPTSRLVRRSLPVAMQVLLVTAAVLQRTLDRQHWWGVVRIALACSATMRLAAIAILYVYCQPATYPPGSLSLRSAVLVPTNALIIAKLLTPHNRHRFASAVGISRRIQALRAKQWLPYKRPVGPRD